MRFLQHGLLHAMMILRSYDVWGSTHTFMLIQHPKIFSYLFNLGGGFLAYFSVLFFSFKQIRKLKAHRIKASKLVSSRRKNQTQLLWLWAPSPSIASQDLSRGPPFLCHLIYWMTMAKSITQNANSEKMMLQWKRRKRNTTSQCNRYCQGKQCCCANMAATMLYWWEGRDHTQTHTHNW